MTDIQRILCPVDFSDFSRHALDHAVAIAKWFNSTVTLLHAVVVAPAAAYAPADLVFPSMTLTREDREELLTFMAQFAATEAGSTVPLRFEVTQGGVASEILAYADAMPADLIVIGTHGRSGFDRLVLGSVAERVLRKATCPVLSVPRRVRDAVPVRPFGRILCAIDFSDCSLRALAYATALAQHARGRLTVVHALEHEPGFPRDLHETVAGGPASLGEYIAAAEADRRERLHRAVGDDVRGQCTVETTLVHGKPNREILRLAAEQEADLIVIGIHGRAALDLMFFGSTAQHVVREATCPVLTLRTA